MARGTSDYASNTTARHGHRRTVTGALLAGALVFGAAACGDDGVDLTDDTSGVEPIGTQAEEDEPIVTTDVTVIGTTDDTVDSAVTEVINDTLLGEGVDLFLSLVDLFDINEITTAEEITLFVPSDEAFMSVEADEFAALIDDPGLIRDVLEAHLVEGRVVAADLSDGLTVTPVSGEPIDISVDGDTVMVGRGEIIRSDIMFEGGVVHIIDDVLALPEL